MTRPLRFDDEAAEAFALATAALVDLRKAPGELDTPIAEIEAFVASSAVDREPGGPRVRAHGVLEAPPGSTDGVRGKVVFALCEPGQPR